MSNLDEWDEVIVKLGLADGGEKPIFRLIDGSAIKVWRKAGNALSKIKRSAVLLMYGAEEMPKPLANFSIRLTYIDDDGDKILLLNGSDLETARKEMKGRGKIKILAEVKEEDTPSTKDPSHAETRSVSTEEESTENNASQDEVTGSADSSEPTGDSPGADAPPVRKIFNSILEKCKEKKTKMKNGAVAGWNVSAAEILEIIRVYKMNEKEIGEALRLSLKDCKAGVAKSTGREAPTVDPTHNGTVVTEEVHMETQSGEEERAENASVKNPQIPPSQPRIWGVPKANVVAPQADVQEVQKATHADQEIQKETHLDQEAHKEGVAATPEPSEEEVDEENADLSYTRAFIHGRHTCDSCLMSPIIGPRYHATNLPDYDLCSKCFPNYNGTEIKFESVELDRDRPFQDKWHLRHAKMAARNRQFRPNRLNRGHRRGSVCGPTRPMRRRQNNQGGPSPKPHDSPQQPHYNSLAPEQPQGTDAFLGPEDAALGEALRRSREDYEKAQEEASRAASETSEQGIDNKVEAEVVVETVQDEAEVEVPTNSATTIAKEDSPTLLDDIQAEDIDRLEAEVVEEDRKQETQTVESVRDASFALDAEGNGDVAAQLGATFDKVAEVIGEMHSELKRDGLVGTTTDDTDSNVSEDGELDNNDSQGITILSGEHTNITNVSNVQVSTVATDDASHDSWHVVSTEHQIANDEALAHAAQVIGSALFNNDMARSNENMVGPAENNGENEANLVEFQASAGSDMSSIGSVPTTVPTLGDNSSPAVNPYLLTRWSSQIDTLARMGFTDQAKYVEICERLNAAKIGCDDNDEDVSVENILDELMRTSTW